MATTPAQWHDQVTPRKQHGYFEQVDVEEYLMQKWPGQKLDDFEVFGDGDKSQIRFRAPEHLGDGDWKAIRAIAKKREKAQGIKK